MRDLRGRAIIAGVSTAADSQLVDSARGGDEGALEDLLGRYQSRVYRFSLKMCRNTEEAKDVLQDTLLAMVRGLGQFRGDSSVSTWLYTIARSYCIKRRRRSKFAPATEVSIEGDEAQEVRQISDGSRLPDQVVADRELERALNRAIADLAPGYREVLVLRDVEGLPAAEVGRIMGLTEQAVKSRLHRARTAVRQALAPALGSQPVALPGAVCPDVARLLSRKLEGEIRPEVCAELERQVAACPHCGAVCETLKRTLGLCRSLPTPSVPADVAEKVRAAARAASS